VREACASSTGGWGMESQRAATIASLEIAGVDNPLKIKIQVSQNTTWLPHIYQLKFILLSEYEATRNHPSSQYRLSRSYSTFDPQGPMPLQVFSSGGFNGTSAAAVFVFVPGVGGDSEGAWRSVCLREQHKHATCSLPSVLVNQTAGTLARPVLSVSASYDSRQGSLQEIGANLRTILFKLIDSYKFGKDVPLIFFGHSLGGLVINEALLRDRTVLNRVTCAGVVYFDCPFLPGNPEGMSPSLSLGTKLYLQSAGKHEGEIYKIRDLARVKFLAHNIRVLNLFDKHGNIAVFHRTDHSQYRGASCADLGYGTEVGVDLCSLSAVPILSRHNLMNKPCPSCTCRWPIIKNWIHSVLF